MSVRPLSQYPQPQHTALPVPLSQPLPSFQELIAQIEHPAQQTTSLEGRAGQHRLHATEAVFSSPTRAETVDLSTSLTSPEKTSMVFTSKRRLDMSKAIFHPSKKARRDDLPLATDPGMSPIAKSSRREISHGTLMLDEQHENKAPFVEKLDKKALKFPNGRIYSGEFKNDLFHGYGRLIFACGKIYTGDFKDGEMHGFGKLTFSKGNYTGDFRKGKFHGQGILTLEGTTYIGEFRDGLVYGQGMMIYHDGRPPIVSLFSQKPS